MKMDTMNLKGTLKFWCTIKEAKYLHKDRPVSRTFQCPIFQHSLIPRMFAPGEGYKNHLENSYCMKVSEPNMHALSFVFQCMV